MASKLIIFVAVFSVLAVVSEAGMPLGDDFARAFRGISERLSMLKVKADMIVKQRDRMRRQAPGGRCSNDIAETEQPRFMTCYHILEMLSDGTNMTVSNVTAYCHAHCATYIIDIEERLIRDCGFPDTLDPNEKALLNQSCDQGPNHTPCLLLWNTLAHLSNTSIEYITYSKCLQENQRNNKVCNSDCKLSEVWIKNNLGCCYKALVDYDRSVGITDGILSDDNWNICNEKEPDSCT